MREEADPQTRDMKPGDTVVSDQPPTPGLSLLSFTYSLRFDKQNPSFTRSLHCRIQSPSDSMPATELVIARQGWVSLHSDNFKASVRGGFVAMSGQNLGVSKSNRLHVVIFL